MLLISDLAIVTTAALFSLGACATMDTANADYGDYLKHRMTQQNFDYCNADCSETFDMSGDTQSASFTIADQMPQVIANSVTGICKHGLDTAMNVRTTHFSRPVSERVSSRLTVEHHWALSHEKPDSRIRVWQGAPHASGVKRDLSV